MGPTVGWNSLLIELFWPKLCSNGSKKGWIRLWPAGLNWPFGAETDLFNLQCIQVSLIRIFLCFLALIIHRRQENDGLTYSWFNWDLKTLTVCEVSKKAEYPVTPLRARTTTNYKRNPYLTLTPGHTVVGSKYAHPLVFATIQPSWPKRIV